MTRIKNEGAILNAAVDKYGITAQTLMLAEESGELVQAASKANRHLQFKGGTTVPDWDRNIPMDLRSGLCEEIADVQIMINQICNYYNITQNELERWYDKKLDRLAERLGMQVEVITVDE